MRWFEATEDGNNESKSGKGLCKVCEWVNWDFESTFKKIKKWQTATRPSGEQNFSNVR